LETNFPYSKEQISYALSALLQETSEVLPHDDNNAKLQKILKKRSDAERRLATLQTGPTVGAGAVQPLPTTSSGQEAQRQQQQIVPTTTPKPTSPEEIARLAQMHSGNPHLQTC